MMHPAAASIDCDDCGRFLYDLETGKRKQHPVGPKRELRDQPRPPGVPTPCGKCPKESPQRAKEMQLSPKNQQTYRLWKLARATGGAAVPENLRGDFILARNFAELDALKECGEEARQNKLMAIMMTHGKEA